MVLKFSRSNWQFTQLGLGVGTQESLINELGQPGTNDVKGRP